MIEGQPQGDLFANKPKTEQREQTPSQHYSVGQGRKRVSIEDLKAIAETEAQAGDRTVGETLQKIIDAPEPQSLASNISNASTPPTPSRETNLPPVNTYSVGQGRKRVSIEDLKAIAETEAQAGDRTVGETLQKIIDAPEPPGSPPTPTVNQAPVQPPHSSNG